jgi:hypothetical protein
MSPYSCTNGAWFITTYAREDRLHKLLESLRARKTTHRIVVIIDNAAGVYDEARLAAALALLPDATYSIIGRNVGLPSAMAHILHTFPALAWYGWLQDDHIIETDAWDEKILAHLKPYTYAHCNDGWQFPIRHHGAIAFSGEFIALMRAANINLHCAHIYYDDLFEVMSRIFQIDIKVPEVMARHNHKLNKQADDDHSYRKAYDADAVACDRIEWERWQREDAQRVLLFLNDRLKTLGMYAPIIDDSTANG